LGIFVFSEVVTFSFKNYTEDSHLFVEELISQNCLVHENDGHISYINLRNSRVSSEILNQIYGLSIDSLAIGINSPVKYVVDQGNDLDFLSIPSNSLTWENEITASILQIYKMKSEYLHSLPISHEVVNLILSDTISTLDNLGSKFPNLRILQFDKAIFPNNNLGDFKLDQNAKIVFLDSTLVFPNSLSFQFEKYFLQFGFSPNKNYSQYKNLERVIIPAEKFNFEFLNYLDKLKLLRFMVKDYPTKTWMNNLKKSIKNSLPNLVNLEFILPNAGREYNAILGKEFINVNGKENILKWLSVIEKEPNLLFKAN
jgi:hypothetical protein